MKTVPLIVALLSDLVHTRQFETPPHPPHSRRDIEIDVLLGNLAIHGRPLREDDASVRAVFSMT